MGFEWQQVFSSLLGSSHHSGRSQQCNSLNGVYSSSDFPIFLSLLQSLADRSKGTNYKRYKPHTHTHTHTHTHIPKHIQWQRHTQTHTHWNIEFWILCILEKIPKIESFSPSDDLALDNIYIYIYKCSAKVRNTRVQSQVDSYQRFRT